LRLAPMMPAGLLTMGDGNVALCCGEPVLPIE
jgi:hypothetical protein